MYRSSDHEETVSVSDQMNDGYVPGPTSLPGFAAWQRFADGEIDEQELDRQWSEDAEMAERALAEQLKGCTPEELCEMARGNDNPVRQACIDELGRRLCEEMKRNGARA